MTIHVTSGDIQNGRRHNCTDCAVARAMRRSFGKDAIITVHRGGARVNGVEISFPDHVTNAIVALDAGWSKFVRPFTFDVDVQRHEQQAA